MRNPSEKIDLDLVPIMNLVTILIPFLLLSAQFVQVSAIDVSPPAAVSVDPPVDEPLALRVQIDEMGFSVHTSGAALEEPVAIGCVGGFCRSPGAWDTRGLQEQLRELKRDFPNEVAMILQPSADIPYEVVVAALDASRATRDGLELFPAVSIAGGL